MDKKFEKITVNKRDEAAEVVEKIIDSEAEEIILSVPRFSKLTDSLSNFHLIRREADLLKKKVIVESVDDKAIELASLAKLESVNPFFAKSRKHISDITHGVRTESKRAVAKTVDEKSADIPRRSRGGRTASSSAARFPKLPSSKRILLVIGGVSITAAFLFMAIKVLPRAEATIIRKKSAWVFNDAVIISRSQAEVDAVANRLPGETFHQSKNLSLSFPASGRRKVEQYASGKITIFNAYSSDPQPLLVRTRFVAPDGKIFRLKKGMTVPGAKIVDGRIIPSDIEAEVVADEPGDAYNIGPVQKFSIPGFRGTPRYDAFYGQTKEPMKGGFIGEAGYPSSEDLTKAKAELRSQLEKSIVTVVVAQIPEDFKILESGKNVVFSEPSVSADLDQTGNFSIFGEAAMTIIAFREKDLLEMFNAKIKEELGPEFEIKEYTLEYGNSRADFTKGEMRLPVNFKSVVAKKIDIKELKNNLIGKSEQDIKTTIFSVSGLESAKVSLWPFWVRRVPQDVNKIKVVVD